MMMKNKSLVIIAGFCVAFLGSTSFCFDGPRTDCDELMKRLTDNVGRLRAPHSMTPSFYQDFVKDLKNSHLAARWKLEQKDAVRYCDQQIMIGAEVISKWKKYGNGDAEAIDAAAKIACRAVLHHNPVIRRKGMLLFERVLPFGGVEEALEAAQYLQASDTQSIKQQGFDLADQSQKVIDRLKQEALLFHESSVGVSQHSSFDEQPQEAAEANDDAQGLPTYEEVLAQIQATNQDLPSYAVVTAPEVPSRTTPATHRSWALPITVGVGVAALLGIAFLKTKI